uniref:class I SAM-dependent methyltransferase n=1 Tax=Synechococcus sp. UW106 TaxID=368495 RepID=UPI001A7E1326|nr:class I SAM-dependent methyltransferase [Synechococcus sp. UW106]
MTFPLAIDKINFFEEEGLARIIAFKYILNSLKAFGRTLLYDLGCGPLTFSRVAIGYGYKVIAIDGRDDRISAETLDKISRNKDKFEFLKMNVKDFDDFRSGSIVCILGLLYHLDIDEQIALLKRVPADSLLIVDTQIHIPELVNKTASLERGLSLDLVCTSGYEGILFKELDNPMASIGNMVSFWHTPESLIRLFIECGFSSITKYEPTYISKYGARSFYLAKQ